MPRSTHRWRAAPRLSRVDIPELPRGTRCLTACESNRAHSLRSVIAVSTRAARGGGKLAAASATRNQEARHRGAAEMRRLAGEARDGGGDHESGNDQAGHSSPSSSGSSTTKLAGGEEGESLRQWDDRCPQVVEARGRDKWERSHASGSMGTGGNHGPVILTVAASTLAREVPELRTRARRRISWRRRRMRGSWPMERGRLRAALDLRTESAPGFSKPAGRAGEFSRLQLRSTNGPSRLGTRHGMGVSTPRGARRELDVGSRAGPATGDPAAGVDGCCRTL